MIIARRRTITKEPGRAIGSFRESWVIWGAKAQKIARHSMAYSSSSLVPFSAVFCGFRKMERQMTPAFALAAASLEPAARLGKVDTEAEEGIAARYGIRSIPTMILFSHGREIAQQSGAMPAAAIVEWARTALPR